MPFPHTTTEGIAGASLITQSFLGGTSGASAGSCLKRSSSSFSRDCSYQDHPVIPQVPFIGSPHPTTMKLIWFFLLIGKPWGSFICITNHLEGLFALWLVCTSHFLFSNRKNSLWHWKMGKERVQWLCSQEPSSAPLLLVKQTLSALDTADPAAPQVARRSNSVTLSGPGSKP